MEDPAAEVRDVIRGLVERPTFKRQAEVAEKYFTEDATFKHPYINVQTGRADLIAIYQYAEIIVNYQYVDFKTIVYDPVSDVIDVEMDVIAKPWIQLWRPFTLRLNTILVLEDFEDEATGKTLKKISSQRDYFIRSPIVQLIPIIGRIYDSDKIRDVGGKVLSTFFRTVVGIYTKYVPGKVQQGIFTFWDEHLANPPAFLNKESLVKAHTA